MMVPREILSQVREAIIECSGGDSDKLFYANRFVFARLQLDERKVKTGIKKKLIEADGPCHYCGEEFEQKRGICLHRIDGGKGYSDENCVLMHGECHIKYHAENPAVRSGSENAESCETVKVKVSKKYEGQKFVYWWDISPGFVDKMAGCEGVEFVKKDTGERCFVPTAALKGYLVEERKTTRGQGNWGIKVLNDREMELAFEPGGVEKKWLYLPVVWVNEHED